MNYNIYYYFLINLLFCYQDSSSVYRHAEVGSAEFLLGWGWGAGGWGLGATLIPPLIPKNNELCSMLVTGCENPR